ncbi:MAG TPA: hypothetical protein VGN61_03145 [Verrucomicrobiae bacterium]|jgi:hypothetical protein
MKNIRQILVAAAAAATLAAIPQGFAGQCNVQSDALSSPRQTRDPVICVQSCAGDLDLTTTIADTPGTPRMKADPSLAQANSTYEPQCDSVQQIESMPGSPRQKMDPSDLAQPVPVQSAIPQNLSMR